MWHANANASASEGRWAGPGVGAAAAGVSTPAAIISEAALAAERASAATALAATAETKEEIESMTTPIFKPFVMVRIPLPSGYTHGEVLGLNNSNQAVGWMHHQSSGKARPFVFDPALISTDPANAVSILDFATDTDSGKAYAISDADPPVIVGSLYYTPEAIDRAASWEVDGDFIAFYYDSETPSAAQGINADERVVGYYKNADEPFSFVIEGENEWNPAYTTYSAAQGVNAGGKVVGWHMVSGKSHAYSWVSNTTTDINPSGYDYSSALCINSAGHIGGWVADTDEEEKIAALWTFVIPGVYTVEPFDTGASSAVTAINASGEMAITREDDSGVAIWSKRSGVDDADLLDDLTLMPGGSDVLHAAWAINDNGWIGGSYLAGGTGNPQPCLIIPYDVDNNGTPDYREILEGKREGHTDLDTDGNWLLDAAEVMRVGLHSPRAAEDPEGAIDPAQLVRLGANLGPMGIEERPESIADEDWILDIVNPQIDCEACEKFHTAVTRWGTGVDRADEDLTSEILIRVHSMMGTATFGESEALPDPEAPEEKQAALDDLRLFAFRFARCIDYLQFGNESFGGARSYVFRGNDLEGSGCTWEGALRSWSELPQPNGSTHCREEAVQKVLTWQEEMLWAALEGSALAGRPLRMTSAGISDNNVHSGYGTNNAGRYLTTEVAEWCNANQAYFSMHVHYNQVQPALEAIQRLVDETGAPWDVPNWRISTEVGAMADFPREGHAGDAWWTEEPVEGFSNFDIHNMFFWGTTNPPMGESWEDFIDRWELESRHFGTQWQQDPGFRIDDLFAEFNDAGFVGLCWSTLQWDTGSEEFPSRFLVEALRAVRVRDDEALFESGNYLNRYTPLKSALETHGATYRISNFAPHAYGCDENEVCPGCGGQ